MKTIIIDDESLAVKALEKDIQKYCPQLEIIGMFNKPEVAIEHINTLKPDLIMTDIQMPRMNAFTMLEKLDWKGFDLIFVTAFNKYAVKAFEFCAMDYLVKPVDSKKLISAVKKVFERKHQRNLEEKLNLIAHNIKFGGNNFTLAIPTTKGAEFIDVNDIMHIKAESNYSKIFFKNGKTSLVSKPLKHFSVILSESNYLRIHQSHLINTTFIKSFVKGGTGSIVLKNGTQLPISRSQKNVVNKFLFGKD